MSLLSYTKFLYVLGLYFWISCSVSLTCSCRQYHTFIYKGSIVSFNIPHLISFSVYFLAIVACLFFYMDSINLSISIKKNFVVFFGIALNLKINLRRIDIFMMLSYSIQEQRTTFHLFKSTLCLPGAF